MIFFHAKRKRPVLLGRRTGRKDEQIEQPTQTSEKSICELFYLLVMPTTGSLSALPAE